MESARKDVPRPTRPGLTISLSSHKMGNRTSSQNTLQQQSSHDGKPLLWLSCQSGDIGTLRRLQNSVTLDEISQFLNAKNPESGKTPLMEAASFNQVSVIKLLLEAGADPDTRDDNADGNLALYYAAIGGYDTAISTLLQHHRNNVMTRNSRGCTVLDAARDKFVITKDPKLLYCIQQMEQSIKQHEGVLEFRIANSGKLASIGSWKKRFVRSLKNVEEKQLEFVFYKDNTGPSLMVFQYDPKMTVRKSSITRRRTSINSRSFVFEIVATQKSNSIITTSSNTRPPVTIEFSAPTLQDLEAWKASLDCSSISTYNTALPVKEDKALAAVVAQPPLVKTNPGGNKENVDTAADTCVVCMEARPDAVCVPCGHNCGCYTCLIGIQNNSSSQPGLCPVCRSEIQQVIKIYKNS